jgi:predicted membrane-bound spermidine synthase
MPTDANTLNSKSHPPAWLLLLTVFITGASILIVELIGTRVLAPFFGSGIYTWSALIAVTLAALALGYALGGKFADKSPRSDLLFYLCLVAGLWTALTPWLATILLPDFVHITDIRLGVLLSSIMLFSPNLFVLGMACPFAIRLFSRDHEASGRTSGMVFSISTVGSLLAALVTGFFLVPNYGVLNILTFCGLTLIVIAIIGFVFLKQFSASAFSLVAATLTISSLISSSPEKNSSLELIDSSPSFYGHVQVVQKDGFKVLLVDGIGQNYVIDNSENTITYINFFSALPFIWETLEKDSRTSLVIGLGAGQLPMQLKKTGLEVETVEIDPVIYTMARKHFGFDMGKESLNFIDGRLFLSQSKSTYDYIYIDAFNADQIAWHLLSSEALETTRSRLNNKGLLAINITSIASGKDIASLQKTLSAVFPYVRTFNENPNAELSNIVFLASDSPLELSTDMSTLKPAQIVNINQYLSGELHNLQGGIVLSDEYNPIGYQREQAQILWRKEMRDFLGEDYYDWAFL